MTEQQFDARIAAIDQEHAKRREGADAYRDQEMARLFEECGWTQEKIAERMGKRQVWVSQRLCFGRFLSFIAVAINTTNLTERRFREHWKMTKGKETERFAAVAYALEHGIAHGMQAIIDRVGIRSAIEAVLEDGKWYTVRQIAATVEETLLGITEEQVQRSLVNIRKFPSGEKRLETKDIGEKKKQYRLKKVAKDHAGNESPLADLYEKAAPLLDELDKWGHTHEGLMSPVAIRVLAVKLRRLFEEVLEGVKV